MYDTSGISGTSGTGEGQISALPGGDAETVLVLSGDLDLSHVEDLWRAALDVLAERPRRIVLETSRVTFLNSTTLGTFVRIKRKAEEEGTAFTLRHPAPLVRRLLRLSALDRELDVDEEGEQEDQPTG